MVPEQSHDGGRGFPIIIDDETFRTDDPVLTGRQVLETAGKAPPDDYLVYWLGSDNILEDLGLQETIHIHQRGIAKFLTFKSDRSYRFEINGNREDWGAPTISEATLRKLAGVGDDHIVYLEQKDQPDRLIERGEFVDLRRPGIEKFYTEQALLVTVFNEDNGDEYKFTGNRNSKIEAVVEGMYEKFKVTRQTDDRLRCEEGGEDVFGFSQLTLGAYLKAGHCHCLVWLFAGGTGGASCR